jgi:hypothetical protein
LDASPRVRLGTTTSFVRSLDEDADDAIV